ncbi:MAG: hypothetical protein ACLU94_09630 [Catenibacillus sp.]
MNMFDDFMPAAFAMALYNDGLAMNRFTDLSEAEKEEILNRARDSRSDEEISMIINELSAHGGMF